MYLWAVGKEDYQNPQMEQSLERGTEGSQRLLPQGVAV